MSNYTEEFVNRCPNIDGFRQRGMNMTRIEVFVDAAFAFATTMVVISFDAIPVNFSEMLVAIQNIPAFLISIIQLVWIWQTHNVWSKRFGLDDGVTIFLSTALVAVVLIYIYPLRIMNQGMMAFFTNGYLPATFTMESSQELSWMFMFLGCGLLSFCLLFVALNRHALNKQCLLQLNEFEVYATRTTELVWIGSAVIALICVFLAFILPARWLIFSGLSLFLLSLWIPYIQLTRERNTPT